MKPLPEIDLWDRYYDYIDYCQTVLPVLLDRIEKRTWDLEVYTYFLAVTRLYFDGLIDTKEAIVEGRDRRKECWDKSPFQETLQQLYTTGIRATGQLYRGGEIDTDAIKETVLSQTENLQAVVSGGTLTKFLHLEPTNINVVRFGRALSTIEELASTRLIVPIASGGFQVAFLAADILEVDQLLGIRYSPYKKGDVTTKLPTQDSAYSRMLAGENVLVVDDILGTGNSIAEVMSSVDHQRPVRLYGAAACGNNRFIARKILNHNPFIFRGIAR